ncbi:purine-binding chemotaxis protein CheW [Monaibacterium marinum]|uniref:Purine-binding chemotaxis protein CheW n=1 Tax=Pontivivens marinum TaxID=1690039 RepID=A0A2C9CNJ2_9RHOB|nr:chemotaxis protein CheW [Monaibacterium marinum]SOH92755.1 purine-binding chemotaxis protein CheW [Monaibacterium marinum]
MQGVAKIADVDMEQDPTGDGDATQQFLSFVVDGRQYCVGIGEVREIRQWMRTTPLPNQPPHILGVLNLRGAIVSIQDLRLRLGAPAPEPLETNVIVIVQQGEQRVGLLVDAVSDILTLREADIQTLPMNRNANGSDVMLRALAVASDVMVGIIDIERVMGLNLSDPCDG